MQIGQMSTVHNPLTERVSMLESQMQQMAKLVEEWRTDARADIGAIAHTVGVSLPSEMPRAVSAVDYEREANVLHTRR